MVTKVKALVWEECRFGGVIALACCLLGSAIMLMLRYYHNITAIDFRISVPEQWLAIIFPPFVIALLLIFARDHKGALRLGFSQRTLRLPMPTWLPIAVSLASRVGIVVLSGLLTVGIARALFSDIPGTELILGATFLYLAAQATHWLIRVSIVGAGILLTGFVIAAWHFSPTLPFEIGAFFGQRSTAVLGTTVFFAFLLAYAVGIRAVHAARIGQGTQFIEGWRCLSYAVFRTADGKQRKPFASPLHALTWLHLRTSYSLLPLVTLGLSLLFWAVLTAPNCWPFLPFSRCLSLALFNRCSQVRPWTRRFVACLAMRTRTPRVARTSPGPKCEQTPS